MPRYDYDCEKCQKEFKDVEAAYEDRTIPCPACENDMNRKFPTGHTYTRIKNNGASTRPGDK